LAKWFQRRFKKIANQKQELPVSVMFVIVSDWVISKKSSLKPPGQMNQNLVGSILGRFSLKVSH
jgi:hypothetical protein